MNELARVERELQAVSDREKALKTMEGRLRAEDGILSCLQAMVTYGYKPIDAPQEQVARLWERSLEPYIALYGIDLIKMAFVKFAELDEREYKAFPTVSDIIAMCKRLGKNPRAEYAKRQYDALVAKLKQEQEEQLQMWLTPEKEKELDEEFERRKKNV